MSEHDEHSTFIKTPQQLIVVVLLALIVPIILIVLTVRLVLDRPNADPGALTAEAVAARIQPVGRVDFSAAGAAPAAPASGGAPAAKSAPDGKKTYETACVACHLSGVANAPKLGDKSAWAPRLATGIDGLVKSVVTGKGAMPPKAGNPGLSEADIRATVEYMVAQSK
ncbi:MAG: c-type cytochrome [Proteobacteria bacterium]|nr:c-type cytochrome [Pseudomonadota bacterium]